MNHRWIITGLLLAFCVSGVQAQDSDRRGRRGGRDTGMRSDYRGAFEAGPPEGDRRSRRPFGSGHGGFDPVARLDANQNGVIDQEEIDGIPDRIRRMMDARGFQVESGESVDVVRNRVRQQFDEDRQDREPSDRDDGPGNSGRANRSTPPPAFKPRDRKRITIDLPKSYTEVDTDFDGQIGLYEWIVARRTDLELFDNIDLNIDGLLTPRELAAWDQHKETAAGKSAARSKRERLLIVDGSTDSSAQTGNGRPEVSGKEADDDKPRDRRRGERRFGRPDRARD